VIHPIPPSFGLQRAIPLQQGSKQTQFIRRLQMTKVTDSDMEVSVARIGGALRRTASRTVQSGSPLVGIVLFGRGPAP